MSSRNEAVFALVVFGLAGWLTSIAWHPGKTAVCPSGYVAVFRVDLTPACAGYVVEPAK